MYKYLLTIIYNTKSIIAINEQREQKNVSNKKECYTKNDKAYR